MNLRCNAWFVLPTLLQEKQVMDKCLSTQWVYCAILILCYKDGATMGRCLTVRYHWLAGCVFHAPCHAGRWQNHNNKTWLCPQTNPIKYKAQGSMYCMCSQQQARCPGSPEQSELCAQAGNSKHCGSLETSLLILLATVSATISYATFIGAVSVPSGPCDGNIHPSWVIHEP